MFSGIVEESAQVYLHSHREQGSRFVVSSRLDHRETALGDSIALNGVCLTVVAIDSVNYGDNQIWNLSFDIASETLRCTSLGSVESGALVHLERSLKVGDRIHGHFVSGHVDKTVPLLRREQEGATLRLFFSLSSKESLEDSKSSENAKSAQDASLFIVPKGSISINGTSLTVGEVDKDSFSVYIIPHTADVTQLGALKVGDLVNIEYDMLARYIHKRC